MSTKAMQALIDMVLNDTPWSWTDAGEAARKAQKEVAAIRAAAKHISEGEGDEALRNCGEDYDAERSLFGAIAQEGT